MLSLLPVDPILCTDIRPGQPAFDSGVQRRLAAQSRGEGDVGELDPELTAQPAERAKLIQLTQSVETVARQGSLGDDETSLLEVTKHASRPSGRSRRRSDSQAVHADNLNTKMLRFARRIGSAVLIL